MSFFDDVLDDSERCASGLLSESQLDALERRQRAIEVAKPSEARPPVRLVGADRPRLKRGQQ